MIKRSKCLEYLWHSVSGSRGGHRRAACPSQPTPNILFCLFVIMAKSHKIIKAWITMHMSSFLSFLEHSNSKQQSTRGRNKARRNTEWNTKCHFKSNSWLNPCLTETTSLYRRHAQYVENCYLYRWFRYSRCEEIWLLTAALDMVLFVFFLNAFQCKVLYITYTYIIYIMHMCVC